MRKLPSSSTSPIGRQRVPLAVEANAPIDVRVQQAPPSTPATAMPQRMTPTKLLRFPDVRERTGLSRSTIWRLERRGEFPRHRRVSANTVAWVEEEVTRWIRSRIDHVAV